ncbi:hypothetical protein GCM10022631_02940 [Deinococcus rubellus]|uniref:twin-arginine translocase TatA/TatE family subunit n=1 Tax=Deinococcus rubellus TaxID=1889240 RepID=UPI0031E7C6D2
MSLAPTEIILILFVAFLLFGIKKLPEIGKGLGEGVREFRNSGRELMHPADPLPDQRSKN